MSGVGKLRSIYKYLRAFERPEGVGATVRRAIGVRDMRYFSPFLMMDDFKVAPPAGFPDHPHHGQETITYVMQGMIAHEDFTGARGVLGVGDLQFMTAGKGIMHSEIPVKMENDEPCLGMQLWVDLPKELKNTEPRYRDLRDSETPVVQPNDKVWVKVISGKAYGVESLKDLAYTPVHYYHYKIQPGGQFEQSFPTTFNVFLYLIKGKMQIAGDNFSAHDAVFFSRNGEGVSGSVPLNAEEGAEFVLIGGQVLDQPVVQYGPFVETSKDEMYKVLENYDRGVNGFERAKGWHSKISKGVKEQDLNENKTSLRESF